LSLPPCLSRPRSVSWLPATSQPHPLSLHDALPIYLDHQVAVVVEQRFGLLVVHREATADDVLVVVRTAPLQHPPDQLLLRDVERSEEHTSELQSRENLVCRLLLEKKKQNPTWTWTR